MTQKTALGALGVTDLCILREGPPPFDFQQLGFAEPDNTPFESAPAPSHDNTYWQAHGWQP